MHKREDNCGDFTPSNLLGMQMMKKLTLKVFFCCIALIVLADPKPAYAELAFRLDNPDGQTAIVNDNSFVLRGFIGKGYSTYLNGEVLSADYLTNRFEKKVLIDNGVNIFHFIVKHNGKIGHEKTILIEKDLNVGEQEVSIEKNKETKKHLDWKVRDILNAARKYFAENPNAIIDSEDKLVQGGMRGASSNFEFVSGDMTRVAGKVVYTVKAPDSRIFVPGRDKIIVYNGTYETPDFQVPKDLLLREFEQELSSDAESLYKAAQACFQKKPDLVIASLSDIEECLAFETRADKLSFASLRRYTKFLGGNLRLNAGKLVISNRNLNRLGYAHRAIIYDNGHVEVVNK